MEKMQRMSNWLDEQVEAGVKQFLVTQQDSKVYVTSICRIAEQRFIEVKEVVQNQPFIESLEMSLNGDCSSSCGVLLPATDKALATFKKLLSK